MFERDEFLEVAPHYIAMLLLLFLTLSVVHSTAGKVNFWVGIAIVLLITLAYPGVVRTLGVAPSSWEK